MLQNIPVQQTLFEVPELSWIIKNYFTKLQHYKQLLHAYPQHLWKFHIERSAIVSEVKILSTYLINAGYENLVNNN